MYVCMYVLPNMLIFKHYLQERGEAAQVLWDVGQILSGAIHSDVLHGPGTHAFLGAGQCEVGLEVRRLSRTRPLSHVVEPAQK